MRLSSAHFPQSNGRAEVAVKGTKRLLRSNTGPGVNLDQGRATSSERGPDETYRSSPRARVTNENSKVTIYKILFEKHSSQ